MQASDPVDRRRIAIVDGQSRYDLVLPSAVTLDVALSGVGVPAESGRRVLVDRTGREVSGTLRAADLADGIVLAVVDLDEAPPSAPASASSASRARTSASGAWWAMGAAGIVAVIVALLLPDAIPPVARVAVAVVAAAGAVLSATVWAVRATVDRPRRLVTVLAPLLLAFAAGVVAVPPLPASGVQLAVFAGSGAATVLAGMLSLLVRPGGMRAGLGTITLILLVLTGVWGIALLLALPVQAPAAVSLGAIPVALRALPSTLLDVAPGMFIDYRRFQRTRWTVRQKLPEEGGPIGATAARDLVDRSSARLLVGTALLTAVAAVTAPFAIPALDAADPIVLAGRIALAVTTALALLLGARRASVPVLRWMPRAAAVVIVTVAVLAAARTAGSLMLTVAAGLLLAAAVAVAFAIVPASRGARSLAWSRLGDLVEGMAVVLSLPAGLVAADVLNLLRGMMGG